jgi:hypothetical protein
VWNRLKYHHWLFQGCEYSNSELDLSCAIPPPFIQTAGIQFANSPSKMAFHFLFSSFLPFLPFLLSLLPSSLSPSPFFLPSLLSSLSPFLPSFFPVFLNQQLFLEYLFYTRN